MGIKFINRIHIRPPQLNIWKEVLENIKVHDIVLEYTGIQLSKSFKMLNGLEKVIDEGISNVFIIKSDTPNSHEWTELNKFAGKHKSTNFAIINDYQFVNYGDKTDEMFLVNKPSKLNNNLKPGNPELLYSVRRETQFD